MSALLPLSSILPSTTCNSPQCSSASVPLLPEDAVATSLHLQHSSAVRKLTRDLEHQKPRHLKRSQLSPGEAVTPMKRIVHTAVYKQKLNQYNETLKYYGQYIDQLLSEKVTELTKIIEKCRCYCK